MPGHPAAGGRSRSLRERISGTRWRRELARRRSLNSAYRLVVGLYDLATVTPLPVAQPDQPRSQRVLLTTLEGR